MKKIVALVLLVLIIIAWLFLSKQTEQKPSSFKLPTNKQVFLGKRTRLQSNALHSFKADNSNPCIELTNKLSEFDFNRPVEDVLTEFRQEDFSQCHNQKLVSNFSDISESCFKKVNLPVCQYHLVFARSLLRIEGVISPETIEELADAILSEFSKKNPDFKNIEKFSDKMLALNPTDAIQKVWAISKLISQNDYLKHNPELFQEIMSRIDPKIMASRDMRDFAMILKVGFDPVGIEKEVRDYLREDSKPIPMKF